MLVSELWQLVDGGEDDHRLIAPRAHPLDPMDRTAHKVEDHATGFMGCESIYVIL